jgi:exonuclease SbcC
VQIGTNLRTQEEALQQDQRQWQQLNWDGLCHASSLVDSLQQKLQKGRLRWQQWQAQQQSAPQLASLGSQLPLWRSQFAQLGQLQQRVAQAGHERSQLQARLEQSATENSPAATALRAGRSVPLPPCRQKQRRQPPSRQMCRHCASTGSRPGWRCKTGSRLNSWPGSCSRRAGVDRAGAGHGQQAGLLPEYEQTLAALRAQYRQLQEQLGDRQRLLEMELRIQGLEAQRAQLQPGQPCPCAARNTTRWLSVTMRQMLRQPGRA